MLCELEVKNLIDRKMDSLIQSETVPSWGSLEPGKDGMPALNSEEHNPSHRSPFLCEESINNRIAVFTGDPLKLKIDLIANPTNETIDQGTDLCGRILKQGGSGLVSDCHSLVPLRTGEVKLTKGYSLAARYVAHTVGPRYNARYRTAAESALFNCYRGVLHSVCEKTLSTLALPIILSKKKGYPLDQGAHIACRAVRRFLEKKGKEIEKVIFCMDESEWKVYSEIVPLYFPRNLAEEAWARMNLPGDIGDEEGEPVIEERKIRIGTTPMAPEGVASVMENMDESDDESVRERWMEAGSFSSMSGDHDEKRQQELSKQKKEADHIVRSRRYQRWLQRARSEDLAEIASLNILRVDGVDNYGRRIVTFIGRNCPKKLDHDKALCYFVNAMDAIVNKDYVIIYYQTLCTSKNNLDSALLRRLHETVDERYSKNLQHIYVVHPSFWSKAVAWFLTTFTMTDLKKKIKHVSMVRDLFSRELLDPDQLDVPDFVIEYDKKVNKDAYMKPSTEPKQSRSKDDANDL
eukprot:m.96824 g.96824  ORF g.96824 m.96824 type:complete len:520 (+) comp13568_c0_seq1:233-1792(+)